MTPLTKEQAAIIGLYTGVTFGPFADIHKLAEETLGRPVFTHEFAGQKIYDEVRGKLLPLIAKIAYKELA